MDSLSNYDAIIYKDNAKASFIILSRYSQGWSEYDLKPIKGNYSEADLPNMFSVNSADDVVISFSVLENEEREDFSENKPSYKFTIRTRGNKPVQAVEEQFNQFDEKTQKENIDLEEDHSVNIMPKLPETEKEEKIQEDLLTPPKHEIEPPIEIEEVVE